MRDGGYGGSTAGSPALTLTPAKPSGWTRRIYSAGSMSPPPSRSATPRSGPGWASPPTRSIVTTTNSAWSPAWSVLTQKRFRGSAEIEEYYAAMRPRLSPDPMPGPTALTWRCHPSMGPRLDPGAPAVAWGGGLRVSFLPAWARRMYGLPGLPTTDITATLTARALRATIRRLPTSVLEGPLYRAALARAARAARMPASTTRKAGARG